MVSNWLWIIGGVFVAILAATIAARLINQFTLVSQKQEMINKFNELYNVMESVCLQEVGNSRTTRFSLYNFVRVVYVSDTSDVKEKVIDKIMNKEVGSGSKLCIQFKDEDYVRCVDLSCNARMPYIGSLPEHIDVKIFVKKLLGEALIKEYTLKVQKTSGNEIEVVAS